MKRVFLAGLVVGLLLVSVFPAAAQDDVCFQQGGVWNDKTGKCEIAVVIDVSIEYPLEFADYAFVTQAVDGFLAEARTAFLVPLSEYGFFSPAGMLTLDVDYEVFNFSPDIASLKFSIYEYTGGAHGGLGFMTFTFDFASERVLALDDLFLPGTSPLDVIAPLVQADLKAQLGEITDPEWIANGTAPTPENYQNWVLTPESLVVIFPAYQVAAYAAGPQQVTIPLSTLSDVLAEPFNGM